MPGSLARSTNNVEKGLTLSHIRAVAFQVMNERQSARRIDTTFPSGPRVPCIVRLMFVVMFSTSLLFLGIVFSSFHLSQRSPVPFGFGLFPL